MELDLSLQSLHP